MPIDPILFIPLFDRTHGPPSVPTCQPERQRAMGRSRRAEGPRAERGVSLTGPRPMARWQ
jgi:hypothetical protein